MRAKVDLERGFGENGPSVRYQAIRVGKHSYADANENLLMQLKAFGEQPALNNQASQEEGGVSFFWGEGWWLDDISHSRQEFE